MRTAVRAELREISINALGMDSGDEAGHAIASGGLPDVIVLEATAALLSDPIIQNLVQRVPTILVSSRTVTVSLPDPAAVLYRPVRISEIVARVRDLLAQNHAA
jgi:DNA-binding response OmpR family regulator